MVNTDIQLNLHQQVTDESYTQGMVEDPVLLLQASRGRFQYAVIDRQRQKAVVLRDYQLVSEADKEEVYISGLLPKIYEEDDLLSSVRPDQVIMSIQSAKHSLVPDPLFSKDHLRETLSLTCTTGEEDRYYEDAIRSANAHMVFAVKEDFLRETGELFKEASLFHSSSAFIESQLRLNKHETEPVISVLLGTKDISIVVTQGSELRFFNIFAYNSAEDFMYYLLFAFEQLQLNPDVTPVRCYGEIEKISAHWMMGRKYIRNISFGDKPESLSYSYGFDKISGHQYFGLFSQYLCVS